MVAIEILRWLHVDVAQMIAPATPHIAEELWMKIGGHGILSRKELNPTDALSEDKTLLAEENYLKSVIDTSRNLLTLAQRHLTHHFRTW